MTIGPADAANKEVKWSTSNAKVATVSAAGKVLAKAPGVANISAISVSGSKKAVCKVTVYQAVTRILLNHSSLGVKKGKTARLVATVLPSNATNKQVMWMSSNLKIASVSSSGVVKALKKGTAYIYAISVDGNKNARCKLLVK